MTGDCPKAAHWLPIMKNLMRVVSILLAMTLSADRLSAAAPIVIGLDADMSSIAAEGGEAIRRGIFIAIDEINQQGGVLGRQLELKVKDHRGNPARGVDNIDSLALDPQVVAILGGVHTPVALRELETIHRHGIPYLSPWAAGTPIIDNGFEPNFAFRLSVRDQHAGAFLVEQALKAGYTRPGLLLEQTPWGKSNEKAIATALTAEGIDEHPTEWLNWGTDDLKPHLASLRNAGADVILLVANAPEGAVLVRTLGSLDETEGLPVISHWGITGGDFPAAAGPALARVQLSFLQTFSFFNPPNKPHAERILADYCRLFQGCDAASVLAPAGTAHAYDLVHILARAIELAGGTNRGRVRDALEQVRDYAGLTRHFSRPFTPERHDALDAQSFQLGYFDEHGTIRPVHQDSRPGS